MISTVHTTKRFFLISALILVIASLPAGFLPSAAASAGRRPPQTVLAAAPSPQQAATKPLQRWQKAMERLPVPGKGCFTASYPKVGWRSAPCTTAPTRPYPPAPGHRPQTVGKGNDFAAEVTGLMSGATGSFDSVSGVTSESDNGVANTFSLQLNTKPFTTSLCSGSGNPSGCQGWQQFLYSNSGVVFIQYWLLRYNATCPSGWNTFSFPASTDVYCWLNGPNADSVPVQSITNLGSLRLTGTANAGGTDTVVMTTGSGTAHAANMDSILNLASGWTGVEFAVVGDGNSSQAAFNAGSTLVVRTTVHNGTINAPTCVLEGFTGETNNLNLVGTSPILTGASPSIVSTQTNDPGTAGSCASGAGIGDTHLTTFGGLLYDFQASGDFVLAQTGPHFIVQTRQVSGAPTWPNAAINQAVATRIGTSDVAVCLAPTPLKINRRTVDLADGKQLDLPDGGDVVRQGNVYVIRGKSGDSVRAEVNAGWIDVSVGLGRWPAQVHGLLANAGTNVNAVEARDGTELTSPVPFEDLYHRYGDSWRVPPSQSLLSACGRKVARGNPRKPFYVQDLKPAVYKRARGVCVGTGVKAARMLDACTLDVAVLGKKAAAAFVRAPRPR